MVLSIFKTILKRKHGILTLFLVLFSNCSPFYYFLFQTKESNEEPSLTQYLTPFLVVSAINNANASSTGLQVTYPWGSFTERESLGMCAQMNLFSQNPSFFWTAFPIDQINFMR
jgi:hypothetical protein